MNPSIPDAIKSAEDRQLSFVPMEAIGEDWSLDLSRTRAAAEVLSGYSFFEDGDILFAKVTPCFENGKAAIVAGLTDGVGFGTTEVTVVRPQSGVNTRFLFYVLNEDRFKQLGVAEMTGAGGLKRVPDRVVRDFLIDVPGRIQQDRIADFLDRETAEIDAFITDQEELIGLLAERRAATISHAVTKGLDPTVPMKESGIEWLGQVPKEWSLVRTRFLCQIQTGYGDTADAVEEGKFPFYVRSDTPLCSDSFEFEGEAVLTAGDGAGVGKVFHLVSGKFAAHQRVYVLTKFRQVNATFFYYYFSSLFGKVALDGSAKSTVDSVRRSMLTELPVCFPDPPAQAEIVKYVEREIFEIEAALEDARKAVALSRERRAALISAAVTGKIDVREHGAVA